MDHILVCGSRGWKDRTYIYDFLDHLHKKLGFGEVLHGGAVGADIIANSWAASRMLATVIYLPNWTKYGKGAGYIRNVKMLDTNPMAVVAFWDGKSRGTMHTVKTAVKRGIPTFLHNSQVIHGFQQPDS